MIESWRWYGPYDRITLPEIAQTGAAGIVTALHDIPYGEIWPQDRIAARKGQIAAAGFDWVVVESLPVHERIKRGDGDLSALFANYRQSMANLAAEGITTICYNFMPLLDWTRTDLAAPLPRGGTCLRFEAGKMAAFEIHMLGREAARDDYPPEALQAAAIWHQQATEAERAQLLHAIMSGLPGAYDRYDIAGLRKALTGYDGIGRGDLRVNFRRFLQEVVPAAEDLGMRFCVHPDDPPRDILGLPRIVSDADDIAWLLEAVDSPANGLTFCTGSLGANPANDLPAMARRFAPRVHFAHLRNVRKDPDGSFEEAAHLDGDNDMPAVIAALLAGTAGRGVAFRPDHGHELLDDATRGTHPGYPLVGRLRGLAELRGVIAGLRHAGGRAMKVLCVGEAMVELAVDAPGRQIGYAGDTLNTAIYLARGLGARGTVDYVTVLGRDPLSDRIADFAAAEGVGTGRIRRHPDRLPGLYAITLDAAGERSFTYWRDRSAARTLFEDGFAQLDGADLIYLSGITLAILPPAVRLALLDRLAAGPARVAFDSNYRPRLWEDAATARRVTEGAWRLAHIALPSADDEMALFGDASPMGVLARLGGWGLAEGAVKCGAEGPMPLSQGIEAGIYPPAPRVVDTTAAGDSFNGAYLAARLTGADEPQAMRLAHDQAVRVIGQPGAIIPR